MKQNQVIGWSLIMCSFAVIVGMIIEVPTYWFIMDILVIIICLVSGILILKKRS